LRLFRRLGDSPTDGLGDAGSSDCRGCARILADAMRARIAMLNDAMDEI